MTIPKDAGAIRAARFVNMQRRPQRPEEKALTTAQYELAKAKHWEERKLSKAYKTRMDLTASPIERAKAGDIILRG